LVRARALSPQQTRARVKSGAPQADPQFRAGNLQRADCHTDNLGNLFSTLSPLYEVADLLHPFWSKPRWPSTIEGLQFELNGLDHYSISLSLFSEAVEMTESACRPCVEKWCTPSNFSPTGGEMATFRQERCGDMKEPGHFGLMYTLGAAHKLQSLF
jgi:hypothetical protein